jgi:hypothetical protein
MAPAAGAGPRPPAVAAATWHQQARTAAIHYGSLAAGVVGTSIISAQTVKSPKALAMCLIGLTAPASRMFCLGLERSACGSTVGSGINGCLLAGRSSEMWGGKTRRASKR